MSVTSQGARGGCVREAPCVTDHQRALSRQVSRPLITLSLIVTNHQLRSGERHPEAAQHLRGEQGGRRAVRGQLGRLRRQRREQGAQERVSGALRCRNHLHVNRCRL